MVMAQPNQRLKLTEGAGREFKPARLFEEKQKSFIAGAR
jgi:hypothetical protein